MLLPPDGQRWFGLFLQQCDSYYVPVRDIGILYGVRHNMGYLGLGFCFCAMGVMACESIPPLSAPTLWERLIRRLENNLAIDLRTENTVV